MFGLILDSLGSTELLFILVVALMFFGPRRLPQLSRTIGKSLAEFRKASEDFKRTWEREVALESTRTPAAPENASFTGDGSQMDHDARLIQEPAVVPIPAEHVMARQPAPNTRDYSDGQIHPPDAPPEATQSDPVAPKSEWL